MKNFTILANVGFYYLMFIAGMEVNLRSFFNMDKEIAKKAFLYHIALFFFIGYSMGF
ncbi:cation:proton antiporter [Campylobacter coli]